MSKKYNILFANVGDINTERDFERLKGDAQEIIQVLESGWEIERVDSAGGTLVYLVSKKDE